MESTFGIGSGALFGWKWGCLSKHPEGDTEWADGAGVGNPERSGPSTQIVFRAMRRVRLSRASVLEKERGARNETRGTQLLEVGKTRRSQQRTLGGGTQRHCTMVLRKRSFSETKDLLVILFLDRIHTWAIWTTARRP